MDISTEELYIRYIGHPITRPSNLLTRDEFFEAIRLVRAIRPLGVYISLYELTDVFRDGTLRGYYCKQVLEELAND